MHIDDKPEISKQRNQSPNSATGRRLALEVLVSSLPYVGSALHTAVFSRLDEKRFARIETLFDDLNKRFARLGSDPDFVEYLTSYMEENERFMLFVRKSLERLAEEHDAEKFKAYKQAFINGVTGRMLSVNVKLEFLRVLDRIGLMELQMLGYMKSHGGAQFLPASKIIGAISDASEHERLLMLSATDTLANLQLIEVGRIGLDEEGVLHRQQHEYRLTQLGLGFVEFIEADPPDKNKE